MSTKLVQHAFLTLILTGMLVLASNVTLARGFPLGTDPSFMISVDPSPESGIILQQDFNNETTGGVPRNWTITFPQFGSFTVDQSAGYGGRGKSAKFVDNSTIGSPDPYRNFTEQNRTIVVTFAVSLVNNAGNNTGLEVCIDDGAGAGADIVFGDGTIQYRNELGQLISLRGSYVANRWYKIKMILNIPSNVYNIHIDEHLEAMNVRFTAPCIQIHRMIVTETSSDTPGARMPIGYIDEIEVRKTIVIPLDFPTIQGGVDAASPGDIIYVSKNRIYFENVIIKKNLWLVGEDVNTTIIDGRFAGATPDRVSVIDCSDVRIYGFTINCSAASGAQVFLKGSKCTVNDNIIISGLGDGLHVVGSENTVSNNTIKLNLKCGVRIEGSNSTLTNNVVDSNDEGNVRIEGSNLTFTKNIVRSSLGEGLYINGSNSTVIDNTIQSNLQAGIHILSGKDNFVRNNTIGSNGAGLICEADTANATIYQNRFIGNTQQASDKGTNKWDNGYPYKPENQKGGGNYWSDCICIDLYSGPSQNEHANCCLPSPDGICDKPYQISPKGIDNYPLFLIQSVTQTPDPKNVTYEDGVNVTATVLDFVQVRDANIYVDYSKNETKHETVSMRISGKKLTGTIPRKPYGTTVQYNVSAQAYNASWLNSTTYPIPTPYFVNDTKPPLISTPTWIPIGPNENQTIAVYIIVTEPSDASQVDRVLLSYQVENTTWWTEMTKTSGDNYTAVFPKQYGNTQLNFTITAFDKAGNRSPPKGNLTSIKRLAQLSVSNGTKPDDPCNIDFGIMSRDDANAKNFTISNVGGEPLSWKIEVITGGPWLAYAPSSGAGLLAGQSVSVKMTVNTSYCTDPCLYVGELSVKASGIVPQWAVTITVTVRDIIIDQSWASLEAPNRCNVNTTQYYAFHAKWANNCSDATGGTITVKGMTNSVNETGWANFNYASPNSANITFRVEAVNFSSIKSFTHKAPSRATIWDRVNITLSIADDWIDTDSMAIISWSGSQYESDKSPFEGRPIFNDTLTQNTVGRWCIGTQSIRDDRYGLTAFVSNSVCCIWDRIKVIGGNVSHSQTNVEQAETVRLIVIYEYENKLFKGANGTLFVNDDPMTWSDNTEAWERSYNFNTAGTRTFTAAKVQDNVHGLTKITDLVGPLSITWGASYWWEMAWRTPTEMPPGQTQPTQTESTQMQPIDESYSWSVLAIALVVLACAGAVLLMFIRLGTKKKRVAERLEIT